MSVFAPSHQSEMITLTDKEASQAAKCATHGLLKVLSDVNLYICIITIKKKEKKEKKQRKVKCICDDHRTLMEMINRTRSLQ